MISAKAAGRRQKHQVDALRRDGNGQFARGGSTPQSGVPAGEASRQSEMTRRRRGVPSHRVASVNSPAFSARWDGTRLPEDRR